MPDTAISVLTDIGAAPAGSAPPATLFNSSASQQPGSFLGMMQDILKPTSEGPAPEPSVPLLVGPGKAGCLNSTGKISRLLAQGTGAPLGEAKSSNAPSGAGVPVIGCLTNLALPDLRSLPAAPAESPNAAEPAKQPDTGNLNSVGVSQRIVSKTPFTFDPTSPPVTGADAVPESNQENPLAQMSLLPEPAEASNKLALQIPTTLPSVEVPNVGNGGPQSAHVGSRPQAAHLSSILEQVRQLQSTQPGVTPAVVALASKAASHPVQLPQFATSSRSATDLSELPATRAPRLKPTPIETATDASRVVDPAGKPSAHTSFSRGNTQEETGSHDKNAPTDSVTQTRDVAVADKSSSFSQMLASSHEAVGSAPNAATVQAAPVTVGTEAKPASADLANPPTAPAGAQPPNTQPKDFGHVISDAQLAQSATHSEMRIAMQTDRLGAVELRAHVTGDGVGAAITVEKRDAHAALAAELPALQQALSEKHLRVDQLNLMQGALSSTAHDAGAQQQEQQRTRQAPVAAFGPSERQVSTGSAGEPEHAAVFDSNGRLSVRA